MKISSPRMRAGALESPGLSPATRAALFVASHNLFVARTIYLSPAQFIRRPHEFHFRPHKYFQRRVAAWQFER
jgi:hypothetical protein